MAAVTWYVAAALFTSILEALFLFLDCYFLILLSAHRYTYKVTLRQVYILYNPMSILLPFKLLGMVKNKM